MKFFLFVCALACLRFSTALIIPDEVPTLLSLIYSNIPTLKKGTDSRLGWGFRFGDRADFQVLLELGPQKDTQPLANQGDSANKRAAAHTLANALYAQSLRNKEQEQKQQRQPTISDTKGGEFIKQWSDDFNQPQQQPAVNEPPKQVPVEEAPTKFTLGIGEVDAKDYIPEDATDPPANPQSALEMLAQMYDKKKPLVAKPTVKPPRTTTSWKDALDNVDLD